MAYLDVEDQQSTAPKYLDDSGEPVQPAPTPAQKLQSAVSYGVQQDPVAHAKLIQLQQLTGIPPVVAQGNEKQVQQHADTGRLDPHLLTTIAPQTTAWASDPDNAAVSGVDEIHRIAGIEQNAQGMQPAPTLAPAPNFSVWSDVKASLLDMVTHPLETLVGGDTPAAAAAKQAGLRQTADETGSAFLNSAANANEQAGKPLVSATGTATFQRILDPKSRNVFSRALTGGMKAVEALSSPDNLGLLAAMPLAPADAGALISSVFSAQMGEGAAAGGYETVRAAYHGDYGAAAEAGAGALLSAAFAASSAKHALSESVAAGVAAPPATEASPFLGNLTDAVTAADESKLRERSPEKFHEAMQTVFSGQDSLRIPADAFGDYVKSQGFDPADFAKRLGSTNYAEAVLSGGDVEVPKAAFLAILDPDHQKALLPDVVDPETGMSANQHQEARDQHEQFVSSGGPEKLAADAAAADAETAADPDFQVVQEQLRQKYVDAGETTEVAETLAEKDANAYANLARNAGLKPSELLAMYDPKVVAGEAPPADSSAPLYQSSEDPEQPRGWFQVKADGTYEIGKTKIGDLSTFVHEPAHAYFNIIGDLAKREGASDILKADHAKILDFLGAKDGEPLTREQQETWARANEQYLREGKAPSPGLKGTFQRFAIWLGTVYKKAADLGVTLSDDIRGVFDRLYAAEDGVNKAEAEAGPHLFSNAEEAGWTEDQFKAYADQNEVSVEQAKSHILGMMNEAALREKTSAWREEESNARAAISAEVDQSRVYSAIRALRKGALDDGTALTMSREELVKQFGDERVKELQKQHPGLYRNEGGIEPESAAEILGFNSAGEMVDSLLQAPRRADAIDTGTREYMLAKYGDIRYDGSLQDQARIALENDKRADGLYAELKALKKKLADVSGKVEGRKEAMRSIEIAPIDAYREAAHQMIESKAVADLQPTRYLDASRKYSREAFDALRTGDAQKAADAKHKELMNHFLFREATKAKEYVGKFESYAKRMQTVKVQQKLGLAGGDYRDQFNRILGRYGLGPATEAERSLADWTTAQYDEGKEPAIDPAILNEARTLNYRNAPVAEIRMVHDALVNVRKLASLELGMEVNGKKIEFNSALAAMSAQARESIKEKPRPVLEDNLTRGMKASNLVNRGAALLMRTEFLMKRLDGGVEGPWHDYLWHLASDSQGREHELQREVTARVGDALDNMPKEQQKHLLDKVTIDGITEPVTRRTLVAMAMNMGNEGNLERLEKTFIAHGWDHTAIEGIKGKLTREEWKFVQGAWDSLKPLGQAQAELEKRLTGLPPVMVKPTPLHIELADGTTMDLAGGYYPVVMDPRFSKRGALQDAGTTAQNLMESGYGRAATSRGNMKERTGFGGPLQLDYEQVLTQHTAKVIKDITYREFMLAANKILSDQGIRQTLSDTLGAGNEAQMMPWLRTIINDRNGSTVQGLGPLSAGMNALRTNVVKAALGFKFSTILLQLTHASSVFLHTSPAKYAQAMIDFVAHPLEMTEQIKQLSPNEMASRGENLDRDMRKVLQDGLAKKNISDVWATVGMKPVQFMDHMLSFPLWLSVYRDAQAENAHLPESEANYQAMHKADGAVRMGLGSNAPKDLPPIMRRNDLAKFLTTMGGFHNLKFNQIADVVNQPLGKRSYSKMSYGLIMASIIPAIMGPLITGRGPKDDENSGAWAAKRALLFPAETMAILNIAVEAMENGGDVRFSPIVSTLERQAKAIKHATGDEPDWEGVGLDTLQSAMEAYGVSGSDQAFKTARYIRRAQAGKIENPNVWDAVTGEPHK